MLLRSHLCRAFRVTLSSLVAVLPWLCRMTCAKMDKMKLQTELWLKVLQSQALNPNNLNPPNQSLNSYTKALQPKPPNRNADLKQPATVLKASWVQMWGDLQNPWP